jgi:glycosyltransferase involved in cell wall biosynthesis
LGLERAKGKWLIFADADDFFTENAFEYLYEQIDSHHEIIYFKVTGCYSDTLEKVDTVYYFNQLVDNYIRQGKDCENLLRYKHGVPWGKMIKRGLVIKENICFDEILASNDTMFSLYSGYYSKSINSCAAVIYCYTISYGSLTNTVTLDTLRARYIVYLRYNAFLQQHNKRKYQAFVGHRLIYSLKYGLPVFFQFMKLAVFYKNTFFTGINTWIYICIKTKQQRKQKKKYIVFD